MLVPFRHRNESTTGRSSLPLMAELASEDQNSCCHYPCQNPACTPAFRSLHACSPVGVPCCLNRHEHEEFQLTTEAYHLIADGFVAPMQLTAPQDGSGRRFVVDQVGVIKIITPGGRVLNQAFLDLRQEIVELEEQYATAPGAPTLDRSHRLLYKSTHSGPFMSRI